MTTDDLHIRAVVAAVTKLHTATTALAFKIERRLTATHRQEERA